MLPVGPQTMTKDSQVAAEAGKWKDLAPQNKAAEIKDDEDVMYVLWQQQLHSFLSLSR